MDVTEVGRMLTHSGTPTIGIKMAGPKKSLGQHWLKDRDVLSAIADAADINPSDTVLEIGPGLGTLTSELLRRAEKVVAVELDEELVAKLPGQFPGTSLEVIHQDILDFDLSVLPKDYVVVANVPYYITSKIIQLLLSSSNKPRQIVLLIQKEVAERLAAEPGNMSILAISAQIFAEVSLDQEVPAHFFTPPPKVDSQVVVLKTRQESLIKDVDEKEFFRLVKAGFSAKRKKLRSSLSAGLGISKPETETLLAHAQIDPDVRAEALSIEEWVRLTKIVHP
ncbi:MAG: Ribosomal small subunit methyltransferase [Candidatus Saccharibacteria bacterium]|nr:Ribosomal small subunit methyltransferase [Candidatus Saccharibacteria bacterium]